MTWTYSLGDEGQHVLTRQDGEESVLEADSVDEELKPGDFCSVSIRKDQTA